MLFKAMKFNEFTWSVCIYGEEDLKLGLMILKNLDVNWKNSFSEKEQPLSKEENHDCVVSWNPIENIISNRVHDYQYQIEWGEENGN